MAKITIHRDKHPDCYTFQLDPKSKAAIKEQLPKEPVPCEKVRIPYRFDWISFQRVHNSIWKDIVKELTGLPAEKLQGLGRVVFVDSRTQETLFEPDETDYLLASPNNATRLRKALEDFQNDQRNFSSYNLIEE